MELNSTFSRPPCNEHNNNNSVVSPLSMKNKQKTGKIKEKLSK